MTRKSFIIKKASDTAQIGSFVKYPSRVAINYATYTASDSRHNYVTTEPHSLSTTSYVTITGMSPSGFNHSNLLAVVVDEYTFYLPGQSSVSPSASSASASGFVSLAAFPEQVDNDSRLKSDNLQIAPTLETDIGYFEAQAVSYNEVALRWGVDLYSGPLLANSPMPVSLYIVYSQFGEPPTISDGVVITTTSTDDVAQHFVPEGKWAYYSMFIKYQSQNDLYYEQVATVSVLVPKNYGSSADLFTKVPLYYRLLDDDLNTGNGGPLERFLSTFGFEIDRTRTTIDFLMTAKDPQISNSLVLDVLSNDLSIGLLSHELGAERLRNILNSIGKLRRETGTINGLKTFYTALTGSDVTIDTANKKIKVYAQRVNLIKDPNIVNGLSAGFDGGSPFTESFIQSYDAGLSNTASSPTASAPWAGFFEGGVPAETSFSLAADVAVWSYNPDASVAGGSVSVLQMVNADVPVIYGDILYFSVQAETSFNAQNNVIAVGLYKTAGYGSAGAVQVAYSTTPRISNGIKYWELPVNSSVTSYTNTRLAIFVKSTVVPTDSFKRMLLERSINSEYFDGHTVLGGWVTNQDNNIFVSDYRWRDETNPDSAVGTAHNNYSVYNSNYQKTRAVAKRLLPSLLPVTELVNNGTVAYSNRAISSSRWTITFNNIPGIP